MKTKINVSLPRNSFNYELSEKLSSATKFILKELMSVKMANTLKIKIHVRKTTLGARTLGQVEHDTNVLPLTITPLYSYITELSLISTTPKTLS